MSLFLKWCFINLRLQLRLQYMEYFTFGGVGGLSEEVDEKILQGAFIPFGEILDIQIPLDYETGESSAYFNCIATGTRQCPSSFRICPSSFGDFSQVILYFQC